MSSKDITLEIKKAISSNNVSEMYRLKDICDRLHNGVPSYQGYSNLPSDTLYEEMNNKLKSIQTGVSKISSKGLRNATAIKNGKEMNNNAFTTNEKLPDLWMGSLPKLPEIKSIDDAVLLPKYDGCSCGVKYERCITFKPVKATTRGTDAAFRKQTSDILTKYEMISSNITEALNSDEALNFMFNNRLYFKDAKYINIRGELVLIDKNITNSPPAAYVAGKLNGGLEVWKSAKDTIEFKPYEIMKIVFQIDDPNITSLPIKEQFKQKEELIEYIPSQIEVIDFLETCGLFDSNRYLYTSLDEDGLDKVITFFKQLEEDITEPIDGVVYCPIEWEYPQTKEEKADSKYGKYAWKPSSEATSKLKGVEYSIARDGKIGMKLVYEPVELNSKKYSRAKTTPSRITNQLKGIGIGSTITVKLCADISPQVESFIEDDSIKPYELPKKCPFCGKKTKISNKKDSVTITCTNEECIGIVIQKYKNLLQILGIKGIADGKLKKLDKINMENIQSLINDDSLIEGFRKLTLSSFMGAIGFGTNKKITDFCKDQVNPRKLLTQTMSFLPKIEDKMDSIFVDDVIEFVRNNVV